MVPTMAMMTMTYPIKIQLAWMISGAPIRGSGHLKASSKRQRSVISQGRRMALHQPATSRQLAFSNKAISRGRWAALRLSATTERLRLSATAESLRLSATAESISHQAAIRRGRRLALLWPISHQAAIRRGRRMALLWPIGQPIQGHRISSKTSPLQLVATVQQLRNVVPLLAVRGDRLLRLPQPKPACCSNGCVPCSRSSKPSRPSNILGTMAICIGAISQRLHTHPNAEPW